MLLDWWAFAEHSQLGKGSRNQRKGAEVSGTTQHNSVVRRCKIAQQLGAPQPNERHGQCATNTAIPCGCIGKSSGSRLSLPLSWAAPCVASMVKRSRRGGCWPPRFQICIFPWWIRSKNLLETLGDCQLFPSLSHLPLVV